MTRSAATKPRRLGPSWWGLLLIPAILAALVATGALKLPGSSSASSASGVKLESAVVSRGVFRNSVTGPGTLAALTSVDIKPDVSGTVSTLPSVGERYNKGELIARLDASTLQRNLETAQLSLAKAQAQLSGTRASQGSSRANQAQTINNAQTQLSNAQRDLAAAQTTLSNAQSLYTIGGGTRQAVQDAQAGLEKAQAALANNRATLETAQGAVGLQSASNSSDLRNLELAVQQAQITVKNASSDLASTKTYAPFSGVVASVPAQLGAPASSAGTLLTFIEDSSVTLPVQVDETEISKVKVGQLAEVTLDALGTATFTGKVTSITPQATIVSNIAVFYVTVTLPNADLKLRPGMTAEAEIIAREIRDAVLVPRRAVEQVRTRSYVTVQTTTGTDKNAVVTTERVRVTTAGDDGTNIAVTSGLTGTETVVLPTRARTTTTRPNGILPPTGGGR